MGFYEVGLKESFRFVGDLIWIAKMEPPSGFWATLWSFLRFLPFFVGLLLLGIVKGVSFFLSLVFCVLIYGNSCVLWDMDLIIGIKLLLFFFTFNDNDVWKFPTD